MHLKTARKVGQHIRENCVLYQSSAGGFHIVMTAATVYRNLAALFCCLKQHITKIWASLLLPLFS